MCLVYMAWDWLCRPSRHVSTALHPVQLPPPTANSACPNAALAPWRPRMPHPPRIIIIYIYIYIYISISSYQHTHYTLRYLLQGWFATTTILQNMPPELSRYIFIGNSRKIFVTPFANCPWSLHLILIRQGSLWLIMSVPALLYSWHIPFKKSSFNISQWTALTGPYMYSFGWTVSSCASSHFN